MICACGVYYFSAPFDRFITCDQKPDERWIRCGTDEECSLPCPPSTSRIPPPASLLSRLFWMWRACQSREKQPFCTSET